MVPSTSNRIKFPRTGSTPILIFTAWLQRFPECDPEENAGHSAYKNCLIGAGLPLAGFGIYPDLSAGLCRDPVLLSGCDLDFLQKAVIQQSVGDGGRLCMLHIRIIDSGGEEGCKCCDPKGLIRQ